MVCHHGFLTAHAADGRVSDCAVAVVAQVAVEEATVTDADEKEWCTDSQKDQEEPHRRKVSEERQRDHQDVLQGVPPAPWAPIRPWEQLVRVEARTVQSLFVLVVPKESRRPLSSERSMVVQDYEERTDHPEEVWKQVAARHLVFANA